MRILLIGPPGSGKGTQASRIQDRLGIPHISSGDILREAVSKETALGKSANYYMSNGELVPDDIVIEIIMERIKRPDAKEGFLLDGFPRTVPQAEALENALAKCDLTVDHVLRIEVPDDKIIARVSGRRIDPKTNEIYHVEFNPPPPEIADRVIQRNDDNEETVRKRLEKYRADTAQLIDYYEKKGILKRISGVGTLDEVQRRIFEAIGLDTK